MVTLNVKGHEFSAFLVKDSFTRRAILFRNTIVEALSKLGLTEDHVDVTLEASPIKKAPAAATWYFRGHRLYYSYNLRAKFVENLYVVSKVIELEIKDILAQKRTVEDFIAKFSEEGDIEEERSKAREILEVAPGTTDMQEINKKFKVLAKAHHPDMPSGNAEKFKAINNAHKVLKRELE